MDRNVNASGKKGLVVGVVGATLGATTWLVIAGVSTGSPLLVLVPLVWGTLCVMFAMRLYDLNPSRGFTIMGIAILWLTVLNFMLGNMIYDEIPEEVRGIVTGKSSLGIVRFNIFLGLLSLLGFGFILKDLMSGKNGRR